MKEILQKKRSEKRVVKYVLRKYTVGVVSVAISASLISPVAVAAVQANGEVGVTAVSQEVNATSDVFIDKEDETLEEVDEETKNEEIIDGTESVEEVGGETEDVIEDVKTIEEGLQELNLRALPNESEAQDIVNEVIADLNSVEYEDLYNYLQPRVSGMDRLKVTNELKKQLGTNPTEDQIQEGLKKLYMEKLDLKTSFDKAKDNLEDTLKRVLLNTDSPSAEVIRNSKNEILVALTYLEKQYSFNLGTESAKEIILYGSNFNNARNIKDLIKIGTLSYSDLELKRNIDTYNAKIKGYVGGYDIFTFIEKSLENYLPGKAPEEWFKEESNAWIVESNTKVGTSSLYKKMKKDYRLQYHLIPLLAVSEDSLYAISTMSTVNYGLLDTYIEDKTNFDRDDFNSKLEQAAVKQQAFLDFWYRISNVRNKLVEDNNIVVVDSLLDYGKKDKMSELWSAEYGSDALPGVREFISPLGFYTIYFGADGQAGSDTVYLFLAKALTDRGQSTYTHELTHILDDKIWLNGHGRRKGKDVESFTRGMFESIDNLDPELYYKPSFNLNTTYELKGKRVQNSSPERFQKEEDLQKYMQGLMDVLYTLDYAEAQSSLSKTDAEKAVLYNQLQLTKDKRKEGVVNDTFSEISLDTASKLKTVNDLIDNNIVSSRFAYQGTSTIGTAEDNGYYIVPLFDPIYAAMQNDKGAVGDITFRRNAYELLAEYGYSKGMVSYISDEYANDEEALKAILDSKYNGDLATFKKDMFDLRISRLSYLKKTDIFNDFADLQAKMDDAVKKDLEKMEYNKKNKVYDINLGVTAVNNLKTEVLQWYLENTRDFEESIYEDITVTERTDVSEEKIPMVIVNKTDDSLWEDESYSIEGIQGTVKVTKVWRTENNIAVGMPAVTTETISEGTPTIVYTGTKKIDGEVVTVDDNVKIPVTTVKKEDPNLSIGQTKTVLGQEGIKKVTTTQKTKKDQPFGEAVVKEEVVKEMIPTVIYIGTKSIPQQAEVTTPDKDDNSSGNTNTPGDANGNGSSNVPSDSNSNISNNVPGNSNGNVPSNSDSNVNDNISDNINGSSSDNISSNIVGNITGNTIVSGSSSNVIASVNTSSSVDNNGISNSENGAELIVNEEVSSPDADNTVNIEDVEEKTEDELLDLEEINNSDKSPELEKNESVSVASEEENVKENKKTSKAAPIAVAGLAVVALAAVVAKSVFEVKLLTVLKRIFRFK